MLFLECEQNGLEKNHGEGEGVKRDLASFT